MSQDIQKEEEMDRLLDLLAKPIAQPGKTHLLQQGAVKPKKSPKKVTPFTMDIPIYHYTASVLKSEYAIGQSVYHPSFGKGTVQQVFQVKPTQVVLDIYFEQVGKRLLDASKLALI